jgi:hypothetical protein
VQVAHSLGVEGPDDAGVVQDGSRLDLVAEPGDRLFIPQQVRANRLDGDEPVHQFVPGLPYLPHAARTDEAKEPVTRVVE